MKLISIVIPAFNESQNIKGTIEEVLKLIEQKSLAEDYEILVVDDHSNDNTFQIVDGFNSSKIICLRLSRRSGSHIALRAGIAHAKGDALLCISADGQDDPSALEEMLNKWQKGAHIVWAMRKKRKEPFFVKWPALIFYKTLVLLTASRKPDIDLSRADFYLLDKKVVDSINQCKERNTSLFGLVNWLGFNQASVEYERRKRKAGKSRWNFRGRFRLVKDWIVAFSGLPLKLISLVGVFVSFIGFLYALFIAVYAIVGKPVPGWASIMIVILVLSGFQMIMLGVIGEYLWRNLEESRRRPLYFLEDNTMRKHDKP